MFKFCERLLLSQCKFCFAFGGNIFEFGLNVFLTSSALPEVWSTDALISILDDEASVWVFTRNDINAS